MRYSQRVFYYNQYLFVKYQWVIVLSVFASEAKQSRKTMKRPTVYIITNKRNGTLYTGVTSNLGKRVYEHKNKMTQGFTAKYDCKKLVYYEALEKMENAIVREKQIKAGSWKKKLALIEGMNPEWNDLYEEII